MDYIWLLWLITRLDEIKSFASMTSSFCAIAAVVCGAAWFISGVIIPDINRYEDTSDAKRVSKKAMNFMVLFLVLMIMFNFVKVLIPSKEDALYIAGGAAVIEAAQSDTAKRLASKSVKVVEDYLDKIGKENSDGNKEEK